MMVDASSDRVDSPLHHCRQAAIACHLHLHRALPHRLPPRGVRRGPRRGGTESDLKALRDQFLGRKGGAVAG